MDPNNIQINEQKVGCTVDLIATILIVGVFIVEIIPEDTFFNILINGIGILLIAIALIYVLVVVYDLLTELLEENFRLNRGESRMQTTVEKWNEFLR